jgi:hypothetical protein
MMNDVDEDLDENLNKWFKEKWVRFGPDGKIRGDCARGDDSEGKPKCLPQSKAHSLGKKGRASAASRKRREDPNPERSGKAINVNTKKTNEEQLDELSCWSGYHRVAGTKAGFPGSCAKNKTNEEQIDEIDRRGFLKGMGAAALTGVGGVRVGVRKISDNRVSTALGTIYGFLDGINGTDNESYKTIVNTRKYLDYYEKRLPRAMSKDWMGDDWYQNGLDAGKRKFESTFPNGLQTPADRAKFNTILEVYKEHFYDAAIGAMEEPKESVNQGLSEEQHSCPHCGGEMVSEELMNEKKDACYYKVKSRYKVWPSAYASGALVKCRNKGASNWGNGGKKNESIEEDQLDEKWTKKYKDSINCSNPKGFSQKAHCAGKQKNESSIMQGLNQIDEGWKEKLGAAALTGAMALGAAGANARVTPDGQGGFTGGLKPTATVTAPADSKPAAESPKGFSKEYLQKAADPNRTGRYMISVEKAQELLKSMP